jgi:hypothetical protein
MVPISSSKKEAENNRNTIDSEFVSVPSEVPQTLKGEYTTTYLKIFSSALLFFFMRFFLMKTISTRGYATKRLGLEF